MRDFETDFVRIFGDPEDAEAQAAVESGTQFRAAVRRPALDVPADDWNEDTRKEARSEFARYARSMGVRNV